MSALKFSLMISNSKIYFHLAAHCFKTVSSLLFLAIVAFYVNQAKATCLESFDAAVEQQLTALDNRDLSAYMSAIPLREEQLMILPDGSTWTTRAEIERGHEQWFKDKTWVFKRDILRKDVRDNWGVVVYSVTVERPESLDNSFFLSMMFAPESDGCWYLQHDQNTLLNQEKTE